MAAEMPDIHVGQAEIPMEEHSRVQGCRRSRHGKHLPPSCVLNDAIRPHGALVTEMPITPKCLVGTGLRPAMLIADLPFLDEIERKTSGSAANLFVLVRVTIEQHCSQAPRCVAELPGISS